MHRRLRNALHALPPLPPSKNFLTPRDFLHIYYEDYYGDYLGKSSLAGV